MALDFQQLQRKEIHAMEFEGTPTLKSDKVPTTNLEEGPQAFFGCVLEQKETNQGGRKEKKQTKSQVAGKEGEVHL